MELSLFSEVPDFNWMTMTEALRLSLTEYVLEYLIRRSYPFSQLTVDWHSNIEYYMTLYVKRMNRGMATTLHSAKVFFIIIFLR